MTLPTVANVARPQANGYDAKLTYADGASTLLLRLAASAESPLRLVLGEGSTTPVQTAASPEDIRATYGKVFSRSNLSGGEGLDRAHRVEPGETDPTRFWDSRNIDTSAPEPGAPATWKLLKATEEAHDTGTAAHWLVRLPNGTLLWRGPATDIKVTANPTASSPTVNNEDPEAGGTPSTVGGLAVLGDEVYATLYSEGIHKRSSGGSWSSYSALGSYNGQVWAVKNRIVAAHDEALYDDAGSSRTLLHTLEAGQTWTDVINAGSMVLAAATDGNLYGFVENAGQLELRLTEQFIEGEVPHSLAYVGQALLISTGERTIAGGYIGRLYDADVAGLRISDVRLIRQWGDGGETRDRRPRHFVITRDSIYTVVVEDGTESHAWRYQLATGGLSRYVVFSSSNVVEGLAMVDGRLFAVLNSDGLYREATAFASTGWLIGPLADFFSATQKEWVSFWLSAASLSGAETIRVKLTTNPAAILDRTHADWTLVATLSTANQPSSLEQTFAALTGRECAMLVELDAAAAGASSPSVYAVAYRGFEVVDDNVIEVPVNISDQIEPPHRRPVRLPGRGRTLWATLKALEGTAVTLQIYEPALTVQGQLQQVVLPVVGLGDAGSSSSVALLRILGRGTG